MIGQFLTLKYRIVCIKRCNSRSALLFLNSVASFRLVCVSNVFLKSCNVVSNDVFSSSNLGY